MLDRPTQRSIVARANLAPSVHNTQPAQWRFEPDGSVIILADPSRFLAVGDRMSRDAALSCGAALEGTVLALAEHGIETVAVEDFWDRNEAIAGLRTVGRIVTRPGSAPLPLAGFVEARYTWRGRFGAASAAVGRSLQEWSAERSDVSLIAEASGIAELAELNDAVSLQFYRDSAYRKELVSWMRLSRHHAAYATDGLNLDALHLGNIEGAVAQVLLGTELYALADWVRLTGPLLSERSRTLSATAIALFHRPLLESPVATGREFYRMWLELTLLGLHAWPMAVIADDPDAAAYCRARFGIPAERRLVTVLRIGTAPRRLAHARRPVDALMSTR